MWSSAYCFQVTVHQILAELCLLKISVNFSFPANSSYSLHSIKLKIDLSLDHDVEQRILFQGYSPPNISSVIPLWKFLLIFRFWLNPTVYIWSSWNFINSYMMMWSSAYCFVVTVHQILAELCPFENFCELFAAYCMEVIVCKFYFS